MVALRFRQELIQIYSIGMWHLDGVMYSKWKKTLSHPLMHSGLSLTPSNSHQHYSRSEVKWNCSDRVNWILLTFLLVGQKSQSLRCVFDPFIVKLDVVWKHSVENKCVERNEDGGETLPDSSRLIRSDRVEETDEFYIHWWHHVRFNWPFATIKATMTKEFKGRGHASEEITGNCNSCGFEPFLHDKMTCMRWILVSCIYLYRSINSITSPVSPEQSRLHSFPK